MPDEQNENSTPAQTDTPGTDSVVLQPHPPKPTLADHTAQIRKISESLREERKLKVGERKVVTIEVDRQAFAKMMKALAHNYTNLYTGLAAIRTFSQMAGVTGGYEAEQKFYSAMLEEVAV